MKKFLALLLLTTFVATPLSQAFARDLDDDEHEIGRYGIPVKVGYTFGSAGTLGVNKKIEHYDLESTYPISIGFLWYSSYDSTGLGVGFDYVPASEVKDTNGAVKLGEYHLYFMINPTLKSNIANAVDLYLPIHIGWTVPYTDVKSDVKADVSGGDFGLYYGIGVGTTIKKSFIVELMYTLSASYIDATPESFFGTNYCGFRLNVGYNFRLGRSVSRGRFKGKE